MCIVNQEYSIISNMDASSVEVGVFLVFSYSYPKQSNRGVTSTQDPIPLVSKTMIALVVEILLLPVLATATTTRICQ